MNIAHPNFLKLTDKLQGSVSTYKSVREEILCEQNINPNGVSIDPVNFARYLLSSGTIQEKRDLVLALGKQMYIKNRFLGASSEEIENLSSN